MYSVSADGLVQLGARTSAGTVRMIYIYIYMVFLGLVGM